MSFTIVCSANHTRRDFTITFTFPYPSSNARREHHSASASPRHDGKPGSSSHEHAPKPPSKRAKQSAHERPSQNSTGDRRARDERAEAGIA